MSKSVLVVGAGRMGFGVIQTLLKKDYEVYVNDPSPVAMERAANVGAVRCNQIERALMNVKYIIFSLPGPDQVLEMVNKITQSRPVNGQYIIDLSTIDPETAKISDELCRQSGLKYLEAPVSGGPKGAATGTLSIMVGGDKEDFEQTKDLLSDIGKRIFYLGPTGSGSLAKICNNIVVATTVAVLSEAFLLASLGGIEPYKLKDILENSVGNSRTLELFGHHMVSGDFSPPTFALNLMHKDVGLFIKTMEQYKLTSFVGSVTHQIYQGAIQHGWDNEDHSVILKYIELINNKKINRTVKEEIK